MDKKQNLVTPVKRLTKDVVVRIDAINPNYDDISNTVEPILQTNFRNDGLDVMLKFKTISIPNQYDYISDYFMNEYLKWFQDSYIFINTGTGTGKTTFIEQLVSLGKYQVLILTNRKANRKQILNHLKSKNCYGIGGVVKVMSYQDLERDLEMTSEFLDFYDFIICDESHYFLSDSDFNSLTNISLMKIMGTCRSVKVFMSATNQYVQERITKRLQCRYQNDLAVAQKIFIYNMNKSATVMRNIIGFDSFERDLLDKINNSQEKWLIFVKSIPQGKEIYHQLHPQLKDEVIFLDREAVDEGTEIQKKAFNVLIEYEELYQKVVITTCLLDNGVNIRSTQLKNIVCFEDDPVEIVQMIGRKRSVSYDDFFDLYLINESNQSLAVTFHNAISKKRKFLSVKKDLEAYPILNPDHYLNATDGIEYRNMSYYDPYKIRHCFNFLGYSKVCREIKNLNELRLTDNPFVAKVGWIFEKTGSSILGQITTSNQLSMQRFMESIETVIDKSYPYKTKKDKIAYHVLISNFFWMWFKKLKGERSDRLMNLKKLEEKFLIHKIPLAFNVSNGEIKIIKNEGKIKDA